MASSINALSFYAFTAKSEFLNGSQHFIVKGQRLSFNPVQVELSEGKIQKEHDGLSSVEAVGQTVIVQSYMVDQEK